jgi:hypothetical protein
METSRRDPTPSIARPVGSTGRDPTPSAEASYNTFSCVPTSENSDASASTLPVTVVLTNEALESRINVFNPKSPAVTNKQSDTVDSTMPTPLLRNGGSNKGQPIQHEASSKSAGVSARRATSIMSGIFRGKRRSVSNPSTPRKSPSSRNEGSSSAPSSPNQQVGGHWLNPSNKNHWRPQTSPKLQGDDDYEMSLSRPSTPGEATQLSDYGNGDSYGFTQDDSMETRNGGRRHVGDMIGGDGSAMYQTNAMHPMDWSYKSGDAGSVGESTISENDQMNTNVRNQYIFKKSRRNVQTAENVHSLDVMENSKTPKSEATKESIASSRASASRQLINDLVWLEKKIAGVKQTPDSALVGPGIEATDSLSYVSNDNDEFQSVASRDSEDEETPTVSTGQNNSVMSSIVCRDCYAPPGMLHIVIHSTKDGPAVHTVKEGSCLEGHIFPGDLIISVDNVDTRSYTAEEVMKMMASKNDKERKITVLHFEEEE